VVSWFAVHRKKGGRAGGGHGGSIGFWLGPFLSTMNAREVLDHSL
jgi:hypothetical protein